MSEKTGDMDGTADDRDVAVDLDEMLGAYALDAVEGDEARRVEEYLAANPRAAAEVREHREVATMLAFTGMDAPADLWSRIEGEIGSPAPAPGPELAKVMAFEPPAPPESSAPAPASPRSRWRSAGPWVLGMAAATIIAVLAVAVIVDPSGDRTDPLAEAFESAADDSDSLVTELVVAGDDATARGVIDRDGHGYLDAAALPPLDDGRTYQLWGVLADNGDVVSLGILGPDPELETFTVEGDVAALAVTIEISPGVVSDGNPDGAYVGTFG